MNEYLNQFQEIVDALRSIPSYLLAITIVMVLIGITIGVMGAIVISHLSAIREQLGKPPASPQSGYPTAFPPQQPYGPNNPYGRP